MKSGFACGIRQRGINRIRFARRVFRIVGNLTPDTVRRHAVDGSPHAIGIFRITRINTFAGQ